MIRDILLRSNLPVFAYRILKWHVKHLMGDGASPLACGMYISSKCNFRCTFCNIWRMNPKFQISYETGERLITELGKLGTIYFSISGGEPLLVPYVYDLLAHAKQTGILYTHLVSNGYLMNEQKARRLGDADLSEISFSLDGDETFHDENRAVQGAFRRVVEAVECMKSFAPNTQIVLNTILNPVCPDKALYAIERAAELGVKIKLQPANDHPSFNVAEVAARTKRDLSPENLKRLFELIDKIGDMSHVVNSKSFLRNYKAFLVCPNKALLASDKCVFGYHHVEFFNNQVFPCLEGMGWIDGFDVSETSLTDIFRSSRYGNILQELKNCSQCRKNYYVCYYEPRLNFPVWNLLKTRLASTSQC